jgi:hypothetical protein
MASKSMHISVNRDFLSFQAVESAMDLSIGVEQLHSPSPPWNFSLGRSQSGVGELRINSLHRFVLVPFSDGYIASSPIHAPSFLQCPSNSSLSLS